VVSALAVGCSHTEPASSPTVTAGQVAIRLSAHIKSIASVADYTAATDNEHLLGRPGLSKTLLTDNRVSDSGKAITPVDRGGIVEVFADSDEATARVDSLRKAVTNTGSGEYDYLHGAIVLRVSRLLTPVRPVNTRRPSPTPAEAPFAAPYRSSRASWSGHFEAEMRTGRIQLQRRRIIKPWDGW
jgi:hypothetical protein